MKAHCRRVASLALEIGRRLRLPDDALDTLEQVALLHHHPLTFIDPRSLDRLMNDLYGKGWWRSGEFEALSRPMPSGVDEALKILHSPDPHPPVTRAGILADIVEVANLFDEHIEMLPYEHQTVEQVLDDLRALAEDEMVLPETILALTSLPRARKEALLEAVYRMPVFPGAALVALEPAEDDVHLEELRKLSSSDPSLAASLIQIANSEPSPPASPLSDPVEAIQHIGIQGSLEILMAVCLRPFFAGVKNRGIWKHALAMAQFTGRLAVLCGRVEPKEAFLAGLVHDAGVVGIEKMTGEAATIYARLRERGCEPIFVERLLCRFDHAELGADILAGWGFPENIVEAVRHHHQPERTGSDLAALLYLAEFWSASEEDLPSALRLQLALDRTGITMEGLESADSPNGLLDSMISAA